MPAPPFVPPPREIPWLVSWRIDTFHLQSTATIVIDFRHDESGVLQHRSINVPLHLIPASWPGRTHEKKAASMRDWVLGLLLTDDERRTLDAQGWLVANTTPAQ